LALGSRRTPLLDACTSQHTYVHTPSCSRSWYRRPPLGANSNRRLALLHTRLFTGSGLAPGSRRTSPLDACTSQHTYVHTPSCSRSWYRRPPLGAKSNRRLALLHTRLFTGSGLAPGSRRTPMFGPAVRLLKAEWVKLKHPC